jgi:hypothetical protein
MALMYMGCMWQIEIAYINICNGWPFTYLFTWVQVDNWAAKDFFYLLQCASFVVAVVAVFMLGKAFANTQKTG